MASYQVNVGYSRVFTAPPIGKDIEKFSMNLSCLSFQTLLELNLGYAKLSSLVECLVSS
jgi:hypothetical protein